MTGPVSESVTQGDCHFLRETPQVSPMCAPGLPSWLTSPPISRTYLSGRPVILLSRSVSQTLRYIQISGNLVKLRILTLEVWVELPGSAGLRSKSRRSL